MHQRKNDILILHPFAVSIPAAFKKSCNFKAHAVIRECVHVGKNAGMLLHPILAYGILARSYLAMER